MPMQARACSDSWRGREMKEDTEKGLKLLSEQELEVTVLKRAGVHRGMRLSLKQHIVLNTEQ